MARFSNVVFTFLLVVGLAPGRGVADEKPGRSVVLPNGLKVFLYEKHDLPLINLSVAVNAGSKDETDATNGIAHLLEHCLLFRGTESRSGWEVSRDIRRHGAYFNANTGQDLTVFEVSCPSEHADFCLKNEQEIVFGFALTPAELDNEKAVVLEEMNQTMDDPERHGSDVVIQHLFPGHPYGRPVYGRAEVVQAARVEDLAAFHAKYYAANNSSLAAVGDFNLDEMEARVREVFGPLKAGAVPGAALANAPVLAKDVTLQEEMDVKDAYLFLGWVGPDCNHLDQYAVDLLTEILGRGVNPLLNIALRSRWDLVQSLSMAYFPERLGGAIVVSMKLEAKNVPAATREALNYLRRCRGENFSKDDYPGDEQFTAFDFLASAKNQVRFASEQAEESGLVLASALARFMLLNERANPGRFLDQICRTSSGALRRAASAYFSRGASVVLSIIPKKAARPVGGAK